MASPMSLESRPLPTGGIPELVELVHGVVRASIAQLHPTLAEQGITKGQFWALHVISSLETSSAGTVARYLGVSPPTACANLDQLEAAGLVRRTRSDRDRRAVQLQLTPAGRKVEARVWSRIGRLMSTAARGVPSGEVATAVRVFRELNRRLEHPTSVAREAA